ncbi:MAG: hypothetical protein Unbinned3620contig1001_31 [Prokaryotic dsDNA virus sp.]|nr:MAG: hypothetical protein Unbinned3620contig1001_31 [Prokaryotic dsDNA virus sp.]|tara:strand:+ start:124 stop:699 length:576 start_codon:yes stop_codon:yes gene_type:complete
MAKRKNSPANYAYKATDKRAVYAVWNPAIKHARNACLTYSEVDVQTAKGLRDLALKCMPDGWAIGEKLPPMKGSGPLGGYAIECEGMTFGIYDWPRGRKGIRVLVPVEGCETQTAALQAAGRRFARSGVWGKAIAEGRKPKASAKTQEAVSEAKAEAVVEVAKDAPVGVDADALAAIVAEAVAKAMAAVLA